MLNKKKWYIWEKIVSDYYKSNWYSIIQNNYTIRWWEIDLIFSKWSSIIFVEVKVIDNTNDLYNYITQNKLNYLQKTINSFLQIYEQDYLNIRLDVAFVKNWKIHEIYENIEL